jgi:hypothetical protein
MRKPKDFDSELKALDERARQLKTRKTQQLGELLLATGADTLPVDVLAGALLNAVETKDSATKEGWRARGTSFFQKAKRKQSDVDSSAGGALPSDSHTLPLTGGAGPQ